MIKLKKDFNVREKGKLRKLYSLKYKISENYFPL